MEFRTVDKVYAGGQTLMLAAYAAVYLLDHGPVLFAAASAPGLAVCAAALLLMAWAIAGLRSVIQIAPQPREGARLITSGVYGYLRHPIYTAIVLMVVGLFLRKPTVASALAGVFVVAFLLLKTRFEERLLTDRYPEYPEYKQRTFGLLPIARG